MRVGLFIFNVLRFILNTFVKPAVRLGFRVYYRKLDYNKPLPPCKSSLLLMPACQLAKKIRAKEVRSSSCSLKLIFIFL